MAVRIVDTDVWSYLYKGRDEAKLYEPHLFGYVLVISFQTQAELLRGALAANWGVQRRQHLESRLNKYMVEPSSYGLSLRWAEAMNSARRTGDRLRRQTLGLRRPPCILACPSLRTIEMTSLESTA